MRPSPRSVRRPFGLAVLLAAAVFAIGACDAAAPTTEPASSAAGSISVTPTLLPEAAVTATMGEDGGLIEAADPARGLSYRLEVPEGAFFEDTEVSVTPIAEIGDLPFDGGLLGGVQLSPDGQQFIVPVILEIGLDANRRAALQALIDDGQFVIGFSYEGAGENLSAKLVEVADDLSTVRLTLFHFSGTGGGAGTPQNMGGMGGNTAQARALREISRILNPPGQGPADLSDPAVRTQLADVFRDWLNNGVLQTLRNAADTPAFSAAISGAVEWNRTATSFGLLSGLGGFWYDPGDELGAEGRQLEMAVKGAFNDWYRAILRNFGAVRTDPNAFEPVLMEALDWDRAASALGFVTEIWYAQGDPLQAEATLLQGDVRLAYSEALNAANQACRADGNIASVLRLLELDRINSTLNLMDDSVLDRLLEPANFCVKFKITANDAPSELDQGESATISFRIASARDDVTLTPTDLFSLGAAGSFTPADPSAISVEFDTVPVGCCATSVAEVDVTAIKAIAGRDDEGAVTIGVTILGLPTVYATDTIEIDVVPGEITCSGDPTKLTNVDDHLEAIVIAFDGSTTCRIAPVTATNGISESDALLHLDSDLDDSRWEGEFGPSWGGQTLGKQPSGTYSYDVVGSGSTYVLTFKVIVTKLGGGQSVTLTVQDVTIVLKDLAPAST